MNTKNLAAIGALAASGAMLQMGPLVPARLPNWDRRKGKADPAKRRKRKIAHASKRRNRR